MDLIISEKIEVQNEKIVALLKATLGEKFTPKSIELWLWKHNENPFGKSISVYAFSDHELIGIRTFMIWQFYKHNETLMCARAVDTAVHKTMQGKGIFTKLTLKAIDIAKFNQIKLIFNTPNKASKNGYLKMGWIKKGKMPIRVAFNFWFPKNHSVLEYEQIANENKLPNNFCLDSLITNNNNYETKISKEYINWRYVKCPLHKYIFLYKKDKYLIILRSKNLNKFIELRICDVFINNSKESVKESISELKKKIQLISPVIITCAQIDSIPKYFYKKLGFLPAIKIGPLITLKNVDNENTTNLFEKFNKWQPSLGCMELF